MNSVTERQQDNWQYSQLDLSFSFLNVHFEFEAEFLWVVTHSL